MSLTDSNTLITRNGSYFLPSLEMIYPVYEFEVFNEAMSLVTSLILSFSQKWVYIIKHWKKEVGATNRTEHKAIIQVWPS